MVSVPLRRPCRYLRPQSRITTGLFVWRSVGERADRDQTVQWGSLPVDRLDAVNAWRCNHNLRCCIAGVAVMRACGADWLG